MYRVKAEAVSGTKVFAGGKWLKCIGNKRVSVGEYIWTDGRCVYGNYQESQQPLVITSQADEAIPIIMGTTDYTSGYTCYTYYKNKLKSTDLKITVAKDTFHNSQYALFVNDAKGKVFFYDGKGLDVSNHICRYLLAINIDKSGNRFEIFLNEHRDVVNGDNVLDNYGTIDIKKNGELLQTVDLAKLQKDIEGKIPYVPDLNTDTSYFLTILYQFGEGVEHGFIENENRWGIFFEYRPNKGLRREIYTPTMMFIFHEVPDAPSLEKVYILDAWHIYSTKEQLEQYLEELAKLYPQPQDTTIYQEQTAAVQNYIYIDSKGAHVLYEKKVHIIEGETVIQPIATYPELTSLKFFLHDGYYYTMSQTGVSYLIDSAVYKIFFTPSGKQIFNFKILTHMTARHLLTKVKLGYLFFSSQPFYVEQFVAGEHLSAGLYFFGNDGFILLGDVYDTYANGVLNQRLLPIKRYKNWQNRIQELTLE